MIDSTRLTKMYFPIVTGFLTLFYDPYKIGPSKEYRYQTNIQVFPYLKTCINGVEKLEKKCRKNAEILTSQVLQDS